MAQSLQYFDFKNGTKTWDKLLIRESKTTGNIQDSSLVVERNFA